MTVKSARYVVRFIGRVQGVGFRATVLSLAHGSRVHGFVRNEPDGSVLMDAEGQLVDLKNLVAKIEAAMSGNIDDTQIDECPPLDRSDGLTIQY